MFLQMPSKNPPIIADAPARRGALRMPGAGDPLPVDEHVVKPETREELVRGRRVVAAPALEPHGDAHCGLDYAIRGHARRGYIASSDLLTRVAVGSDFATDTSVRKEGIDPATGVRYLEELAFEVVNEQSERDMIERAEDLSARGVRRVFAIFVKRDEVAEWSALEAAFRPLGRDDSLEDPCLVRPLPVRALLDATASDDAVARALLAKANPILEKARQEVRREGVERLCRALDIELTEARAAALARMDAAGLDALADDIAARRRWS